jgi:hypothetical protein
VYSRPGSPLFRRGRPYIWPEYIYTVAGAGGPAVNAEVGQPSGRAVDGLNVVFTEPVAFWVMTVPG